MSFNQLKANDLNSVPKKNLNGDISFATFGKVLQRLMYNVYNLLENKKLIYDFHLRLWKNQSVFHTLIHLTEKIKKT